MPIVQGKHYSYSKKGKAAAKKARGKLKKVGRGIKKAARYVKNQPEKAWREVYSPMFGEHLEIAAKVRGKLKSNLRNIGKNVEVSPGFPPIIKHKKRSEEVL